MNEKSVESLGTGTSPGERACAYRIFRYTPNLVRDEWVNIGVLVFDPKTGERRLRLIEEQDEYNRVRRLHPQADETLLRALRDDLEDRLNRNRNPPTVQRAAAATGSSSSASGTILCPMHCNLPRKKASLRQTSMPNLSASTPTTSPRSAHRAASGRPAAAPKCARTARRFSGKPGCGSASKSPFAPRSLLFPATPCDSTTATAATIRAVSCRRFLLRPRPPTPSCWPIPRSASSPRLPRKPNLPPSPTWL